MVKELNYKKSDYAFISKWAKKIRGIEILGGKCIKCLNNDLFVLQFHHKSNKSFEICDKSTLRWSALLEEMLKCDVICANCHVEEHFTTNKLRLALLRLSGQNVCKECGYDGRSLEFHHEDEKRFNFSDVISNKSYPSFKTIVDEIEKCIVLCRNCHCRKHLDIEKFYKLEKQIREKSKVLDIFEKQRPVDRDLVMHLICNGSTQIEIAKSLGYAKSTICGIVKNWKVKSQGEITDWNSVGTQ